MSKKSLPELGVAMIGYGYMGKVHSYAYASLPFIYDPPPAKIKLVAACALTQKSRDLAQDRAGYKFASGDYREVIARDDVHLVNICTPNYLHAEQVKAALAAGKHVYCDKPLAMNATEAAGVVELARKSGVTAQITFHNRFSPPMIRAKQMIEDGFLGDVISFRAMYLHSGYADPNRPTSWRLQMDKSGGGAIADLGSHVLDLLLHLIGDFTRVNASFRTLVKERPASNGSSERVPVDVDDIALLQLEHVNGAVGSVEASRIATGTTDDMRIEIHGTKGALRFDQMDPNWLYAYDDTTPSAALGGDRGYKRIECVQAYPPPASLPGAKAPVGWMRFHVQSIYEFVSSVVEGRLGTPSLEDGLAVHKIMDAAALSAKSGQWKNVS